MTSPKHAADEPDDLDWDVDRDGRMRDHATDPDGEPETVPYDGEDD